jgi:hypothetical protein
VSHGPRIGHLGSHAGRITFSKFGLAILQATSGGTSNRGSRGRLVSAITSTRAHSRSRSRSRSHISPLSHIHMRQHSGSQWRVLKSKSVKMKAVSEQTDAESLARANIQQIVVSSDQVENMQPAAVGITWP